MRCAGIDIEVYSLQTYEDERKLISVFGAASKPLFNTGAHQSAVYLSRFEICDDKHKNQGLGKQLFLYGLIKMKQLYPKSSYFWIAEPLDGQDKKESLFRFYKSCGATMIKNYGTTALFYIDLAKLDLGLFKPEREPSEYLSVRSRLQGMYIYKITYTLGGYGYEEISICCFIPRYIFVRYAQSLF